VIEPFVGTGDLLKFIDPAKADYTMRPTTSTRNTRRAEAGHAYRPARLHGKFVLTNPPYLARNKSENKEIYDKLGCNDLYKCFLATLIGSGCLGGIVIVPLNFVSIPRKADVELRGRFLAEFAIRTMNVFEGVFDDTARRAASSFRERPRRRQRPRPIRVHVYPSRKTMSVELTPGEQLPSAAKSTTCPATTRIRSAEHETRKGEHDEYPVEVHRRQHRQPVGVQGGGRRRGEIRG
jgi:hypothetical protein